ncbi:DUF4214 domain-containing protein [Verticiella sediminum]|uniref:DUF4214 domain-containing protein n=1 Tax=Verticiella sediminum TaxID=1247510 RepID=A0A556APM8_9BURK|nr:DUF4214 domain-containing protein [Verticiella sediminum]TSH94848.1 DUF4214 domain-containing protein [Verticiella sediminum]
MPSSLISSLDLGTRLEGNVITYAFHRQGDVIDLSSDGGSARQRLTGWNDYEKQQARLAFDMFAQVADLTFVEVADPAQATLRLGLYDFPPGLGYGYAYPPEAGGALAGFAAFNLSSWAWSREAGGHLDAGAYGYITLIHEIGHLFGLAHPHDLDSLGGPLPGVVTDAQHPRGSLGDFELNQGIYTMMSYNDGWLTGPMPQVEREVSYGWNASLMALDVAIMQQKYGANLAYGEPGTIYELADADHHGYGYSAIWNAHGDNVIRYQGDRNAVINLMPASLEPAWGGGGYVSYVEGVHGGYTIAHGVEVRTAISGGGDDMLIGNALDNLFDPGAGSNTIHGNGGADVVRYADASIRDYNVSWDAGQSAWVVAGRDGARADTLHDVRMLDFNEGRLYAEAVADSSLAVGALYIALLDRLPEAGGYAYWTTEALTGVQTLLTVANLVSSSDEFAQGLGRSDDGQFVNWLYDTVMTRMPDAPGHTYWVDQLQRDIMDRGEIALFFLTADEQSLAFREEVVAQVIEFGDIWA